MAPVGLMKLSGFGNLRGCTSGVIDRDSEWEIGDQSSNHCWVPYMHLENIWIPLGKL